MNRLPANSTPVDWTTDPGRVQGHFHSYATLMLAISPLETMAFLARGERLGGVFELSQASFGETEDMVAVVDVDAFYHTEGALNGVTLAYVQQSETQQNVEIHVRKYLSFILVPFTNASSSTSVQAKHPFVIIPCGFAFTSASHLWATKTCHSSFRD